MQTAISLAVSKSSALASLREFFLACTRGAVAAAILASGVLAAEGEFVSDVARKTQQRLEEIAAGVPGVMGLVVEDLAGDYRFAVHEDRQFAQASAIKIPILMEVLRQAEEGQIQLSDLHPVTSRHQVPGSGILAELGDGTTTMSVEDLAVLMIVLSDNTATNMLIDLVGMDRVTATMRSLGCDQTLLRRRMMDTAASARGDENVSTPRDAARLLRALYEGKFVSREVSDQALAILRKPKKGAVNAVLPDSIPVAFKPGSIPGVETEWALVELPERPYIVVLMGAYDAGGELKDAMRDAARTAHQFFSRLATASPYGTYIDPAEWAKH